jgi:hypothetical protein
MKPERKKPKKSNLQSADFQQLADKKAPGLPAEFLEFLLHNKKWWLAPIIIVLLFVGLIAVLGGTGAAPFIYALF